MFDQLDDPRPPTADRGRYDRVVERATAIRHRRRRRTARIAAGTIAAGVLGVVGFASYDAHRLGGVQKVSVAAQLAPSTSDGAEALSAPGIDVQALSGIAKRAAEGGGDARPISAQAVMTDRAAVLASTGDSDDPAKSTPVVQLQIHGHFSFSTSPAPVSTRRDPVDKAMTEQQETSATVINITLTPDLKQTLDISVQSPGNKIINLSTLGSPVVNIPL
jgi:hypothetical protein